MLSKIMTAALATAVIAGPALAAGDAAKGAASFKRRCGICHVVEAGKPSAIGPNLAGVVGRKAGSTGFAYSAAMKAAGFAWTPQKLDAFIEKPSAVVKGNRMPYAGLPDAAERADIVAFLATKK